MEDLFCALESVCKLVAPLWVGRLWIDIDCQGADCTVYRAHDLPPQNSPVAVLHVVCPCGML